MIPDAVAQLDVPRGNAIDGVRRGALRRMPDSVRDLVIFATALGVAVARRPETLTRPQFFMEDGQIFYLGTYFGSPLERIFATHSGYLHVIPRLLAYLERLGSPSQAPFISNISALVVAAVVATFVASDLLPGSRPLRLALGLLVILEPISWEVSGSLTYVQWYLAIFLFAFAFAFRPSRAWVFPLGLAALTGPFSVLVSPLYAVRAWRDRSFRPFAAVVIACGAVQAILMVVTHRAVNSPPGDVARNAALRLVDSPILGPQITSLASPAALLIAAALLVVVGIAAARVPPIARVPLLYAIVVIGVIGLVGRGDGSVIDGDLLFSGRYFFLEALAVGTLLILGAARSSSLGRALILAPLCAGVVLGFRLQPMPSLDDANLDCVGGPAPCIVQGWLPGWSIRWPGADGAYQPLEIGGGQGL